jgi:hypothetical protein
MEFHENMQEEQEERLSAWDRLKEKRVNFSDTGKATLVTAIGAPGFFELGLHLPGNLGLGLSAGAIILSIAHGDKAFRAGRWLKERFIADNGLAQSDESVEETPSLRERFLADNGLHSQVEKSEGIILGHDKFGKPVTRTLKQLKNILIMGAPGQGKSSLACWLLSQMATSYGAKFIIIDKNAKGGESLTTRFSMFESCFLRSPAYRVDDICNSIEYAKSMLERRQEGEESTDIPLILVVDEYTRTCMDERTKHITSVIEDFNALGRQFNCFSLCCGQLVNASRTGGTEVRELFATRMILGMKEPQARMIIPESAKQAPRLLPGECICDTEGREAPFKFTFPDKSQKYYREQTRNIADHVRPQKTNGTMQDHQVSDLKKSSLDQHEIVTGPLEDHYNPSIVMEDLPLRGSSGTNLVDALARYKSGESIRSIGADFRITSGRDREALKQMLDSLDQIDQEA